jgi:hypothetical protein
MQVSPTLIQRLAVRDGAGDFFDPTHKPSVPLGFDDGVVPLLHGDNVSSLGLIRQVKVFQVSMNPAMTTYTGFGVSPGEAGGYESRDRR